MSRNRYEEISCFFHIVTPEEEETFAAQNDSLKKIRPIYEAMKEKSIKFYQPLRELSIDERMVKSKARTQFRQYIKNKPTKWGFKFWVLADVSGYTIDFNLYCGKNRATPLSAHGLAYDVVMELIQPFCDQGYHLFFDNFYTSPALVNDLSSKGIGATGTLRTNRAGVPREVKKLAEILNHKNVPRGTGFYIREVGSQNVYCCWRDNKCVTVLSSCYPGHKDGTVQRKTKDISGTCSIVEVPLPSAIHQYNRLVSLSGTIVS